MTAQQIEVFQMLSPDERGRLLELEAQVDLGVRAGIMAGRALRALREDRLYRATHTSFEAYGQERFGLSRARLYQLMDFADVAEEAAVQGVEITSERMARALGVVPPEDYRLVLDVTRAVTGKTQPSSADVQGVADTVRSMAAGMVEHPDTQQAVPFDTLPPERKAEAVQKAVQRGSRDRRDFQGTDDQKPTEWLAGFQGMGQEGAIRFSAAGWWVELTDSSSGEVRTGPVRSNLWEALRAARIVWEEGTAVTP